MEYSKEFKEAISNFSSKDKDKLIFRLLKKDRILSHRLYFELIDPETADDKRNQLEKIIVTDVALAAKKYGRTKYFLTHVRKVSSKITEHVKITTDKFGEVSLNLQLISETLKTSPKSGDHYKLHLYLLNKLFRILVLTKKLDPDYFLDLKSYFIEVEEELSKNRNFEQLAKHHQFNLTWLDPENIPDYMDLVLKEIKADGFLK